MIINLKKLPMDVINKIFSYYYSPQPKELLGDIKNYTKSLKIIEKIYYDFWIGNWPLDFTPASGQDKDWLINDIFSFANKEKATGMGYIDDFYSLWIRFLLEHIWGQMKLEPVLRFGSINLETNENIDPVPHTDKYRNYIDSFIAGLEKKNSTTQVRFFWGILKPAERNEFVEIKQKQIKAVAYIAD